MTGYLTPDDAPATTRSVIVYLPDHDDAVFTFLGLIEVLSDPENWTKFGTAEPEDIADSWKVANDETALENLDSL